MTTQRKVAKSRDKQSTENGSIFRTPLTAIQKPICNFLRENEISIISGEPGTGKDFIQLYRAVDGIIKKEFDKLIFIKPCLEIGKSMGFLPGLEEKTAPYEKSFYDNLNKMVNKVELDRIKNKICFTPMNFIRGNTWDNSVVILSEAQNCTLHELITIATRLGSSSKLFINGDFAQADIKNSGFLNFIKVVKSVNGVGITELGSEFQMRNPMIVEINRNYVKFLKKLYN